MGFLKAKARQSSGQDADVWVRALRDGTLTVVDFLAMMSLEGRVFQAAAGSFTAPITYTAGGIVVTTPDVALTVPTGKTVIPVEIVNMMEDHGTVLILEIIASIGNGTVTTPGTAIVPTNLRTDAPHKSTVVASHTAITAVDHTVNGTEFWRDGIGAGGITKVPSASISVLDHLFKFKWSAMESGVLPVMVGPSSMFLYCSTQAGHGFYTIKYIELSSTAIV